MAIRELYWVIGVGPVWDCIACAATIRVSGSGEAKRAGGLSRPAQQCLAVSTARPLT